MDKVQNNLDNKLLNVGKIVKGATISNSLLAYKYRNMAIPGELVVDDVNLAGGLYPRLMYLDPVTKKLTYLASSADIYLPEILAGMINVGELPDDPLASIGTYNGDTIWYALKKDSNNNFNSEESKKMMYEDITNNAKDYTPYILNVRDNGKEYKLLPFVTEEFIYVDLGKILTGPKDVKSIDKIFKFLNDNLISIINDMNTGINEYRKAIDTAVINIDLNNNIQNKKIDEITNLVNNFEQDVNKLQTSIDNFIKKKEDKIQTVDFNLTGDSNMIYPVLIEYDKSKLLEFIVPGYGIVLHNTPIFIKCSNSIYSIDSNIGDRTIVESLDPGSARYRTPFTYSHTLMTSTGSIEELPIRDVLQYKFQFIVYVKGLSKIKIASKYADRMNITQGNISVVMNGVTYKPRHKTENINPLFSEGFNQSEYRVHSSDRIVNVNNGIVMNDRYILDIVV